MTEVRRERDGGDVSMGRWATMTDMRGDYGRERAKGRNGYEMRYRVKRTGERSKEARSRVEWPTLAYNNMIVITNMR